MFWLSFLGFAVTLYAVSIGRGGGLLYVGLLTSVAGVSPQAAVATSLAILVPTTVIGSWSHWRRGNIQLSSGVPLLVGGVAGAVVGSLAVHQISAIVYRRVLGAVLLWTLYSLGRKFYLRWRHDVEQAPRAGWGTGVYGFLGGMLSSLTGMSGSAPVLAGLASSGCTAIETVGTSLFALSGIAVMGFLMHLNMGLVNWRLTAGIGAGTALASFASPVILGRVPKRLLERALVPIFVALVLWMTVAMLFF